MNKKVLCFMADFLEQACVIGAPFFCIWLFVYDAPATYDPKPVKTEHVTSTIMPIKPVKVEPIMSTKPVVKHDVTVEANLTISDGVTKRSMKSKVITDSVTHGIVKIVNDEMLQATYKIIDDRQQEIDTDPNYWSKNTINLNMEQ